MSRVPLVIIVVKDRFLHTGAGRIKGLTKTRLQFTCNERHPNASIYLSQNSRIVPRSAEQRNQPNAVPRLQRPK
jgi:hypothetical protein